MSGFAKGIRTNYRKEKKVFLNYILLILLLKILMRHSGKV